MVTNNDCNYGPVQYNVITGGANGAINNVVPSTSGFVLTSNGASAQPTFQAAGGGAPNYQVSSSCGNFVGGSGSGTVTNLSVTLTTTGNPVWLLMQPDGNGSSNGAGVSCSAGGTGGISFYRGATQIALQPVNNSSITFQSSGYQVIDFPAAGTYTYTVHYSNATNNLNVAYTVLVGMEMKF